VYFLEYPNYSYNLICNFSTKASGEIIRETSGVTWVINQVHCFSNCRLRSHVSSADGSDSGENITVFILSK